MNPKRKEDGASLRGDEAARAVERAQLGIPPFSEEAAGSVAVIAAIRDSEGLPDADQHRLITSYHLMEI